MLWDLTTNNETIIYEVWIQYDVCKKKLLRQHRTLI